MERTQHRGKISEIGPMEMTAAGTKRRSWVPIAMSVIGGPADIEKSV
jgi:hypothetical protein